MILPFGDQLVMPHNIEKWLNTLFLKQTWPLSNNMYERAKDGNK